MKFPTQTIAGQTAIHADCREAMAQLVDDGVQVDSVVCDPPYHLTSMTKRYGKTNIDGDGTHERRAKAGADGMARLSRGFMGKTWDGGAIAFRPETWRLVYDLLKPGAHLLAFGGTRTNHRMVCAIEDAGFEIRDMVAWVFASGFPKSHNLKDEWQGWGSALKPALEPICLARKPLIGTIAQNVMAHGTGALAIDRCRIPCGDEHKRGAVKGTDKGAVPVRGKKDFIATDHPGGRWPANLILSDDPEVLAAFPETQATGVRSARSKDRWEHSDIPLPGQAQSNSKATEYAGDSGSAARFFKKVEFSKDELLFWQAKSIQYQWNQELANTADNSSTLSKEAVASALKDAVIWASRAMVKSYLEHSMSATPSELKRISEAVIMAILSFGLKPWRAPPQERDFPNGVRVKIAEPPVPIDIMTITVSRWKSNGSADPVILNIAQKNAEAGDADLQNNARLFYSGKADKEDRCGSKHPTVKPVDLLAYLVRLITPPGGTVLDCFAGSGSTGAACIREGLKSILIEREAEYYADILNRLNHATGANAPLFTGEAVAV